MKYVDTMLTFSEFPNETSLCINISNCPCNCPGCHSKYLAKDIGTVLDKTSLSKLIEKYTDITCIGFMGGDAEPETVNGLAKFICENYPGLRVGWYSGKSEISGKINTGWFDYIKIGPYNEIAGPLNSKTTNQRMFMYSRTEPYVTDITYKFWKK